VGAVQKLATAVIVGLVGLATLLVVYLADEPNRRAAELQEQEHVSIERGVQLYINNCLICHGPAGEGYTEPGARGTGRVGMPLGGSTELGMAATELNQSEDPLVFAERTAAITRVLNYGRGLMPAFGTGADGGELLNPEQIHELTLMIQHVDWNHVYNESVAYAGGYPTFPPAPAPAAPAAPAQTPAAGEGDGDGDAAAAFTVVSHDIYFDPAELTIPADMDVTVSLPNQGAAPHNFSIDELGISVDQAPGVLDYETVINAPAGEYEYYCNVPGHKEAGMVGTLTTDADMEAPAAAEAAPAEGEADAPAEDAAAASAAGQEITVASHDIYFDPKEVAIPADTDVTFLLPNQGAAPHNFAIDALGISVDQAPGVLDYQTVINAPAGEYEYYCNVPGHKEAGMVGTLVAE
jgi:plastocyanin/mono/diheme cytochrome c family protein